VQWTRGANLKLAEDPNIDTIVVAADWTGYFTALDPAEIWTYYYEHHGIRDNLRGQLGSKATDEALAGFERMISRFVALGKNVFIILPSPAGRIFSPIRMDRARPDRFQLPQPRTLCSFAGIHSGDPPDRGSAESHRDAHRRPYDQSDFRSMR
jgi:hypothetical protein